MASISCRGRGKICMAVLLSAAIHSPAWANTAPGVLAGMHKHDLLASMIPDNGDQNPYAVVIAPVSAGHIKQGDVLVDNFNASSNLQGTGTTIMDYNPQSRQATLFAAVPAKLAGCPGGIGLTTAMTMLKSGWVIVGSLPSTDGTTKTMGAGCLIAIDATGHVAGTIAGPLINGPWGNMAVIDKGDRATLFVSNVGFGIGAPGQKAVDQATILRIDLAISPGKMPEVSKQTVIGSGFSSQADASAFIIGPTGLALGANGTLYVSDALANRVVAIDQAASRSDSAGTGRVITQGGLLRRPLAMTLAPSGDLLVTNGLNGQVVEIDPESGTQRGAQWLDADEAQSPPGNGDLFGIVADGKSLYYVEDDVNALMVEQ